MNRTSARFVWAPAVSGLVATIAVSLATRAAGLGPAPGSPLRVAVGFFTFVLVASLTQMSIAVRNGRRIMADASFSFGLAIAGALLLYFLATLI